MRMHTALGRVCAVSYRPNACVISESHVSRVFLFSCPDLQIHLPKEVFPLKIDTGLTRYAVFFFFFFPFLWLLHLSKTRILFLFVVAFFFLFYCYVQMIECRQL